MPATSNGRSNKRFCRGRQARKALAFELRTPRADNAGAATSLHDSHLEKKTKKTRRESLAVVMLAPFEVLLRRPMATVRRPLDKPGRLQQTNSTSSRCHGYYNNSKRRRQRPASLGVQRRRMEMRRDEEETTKMQRGVDKEIFLRVNELLMGGGQKGQFSVLKKGGI